MKKILIIFLVIFFVSLSSVSAVDNDAILTDNNQVVEDTPIQLAVGDSDGAVLTDSQIIVSEGSSIQSAIDNAAEGSTIIVQNGTYSEDIIVPKSLSIVGEGAIIKSNAMAFNILPTAESTSISGFNILVSNNEGVGILVSSSGCTISDNEISGGNIGIMSDAIFSIETKEVFGIDTISVIGNNISNCGESGISIKAFNAVISQNNVTNVGNKKEFSYGIHVDSIGWNYTHSLVLKDNYVSNIESSLVSRGIDIWDFAIAELKNFDISGNTISNVVAPLKAIGMTTVVFALENALRAVIVSDLNISGIYSSGLDLSSATGLDFYVVAVGLDEKADAVVRNVQISDVEASGAKSTAVGIRAVGAGCVDLFVLNNNLNNFKSSYLAAGINALCIDFSEFRSYISVSNNKIADFDAHKIKGIGAFSLGDMEINQNIMYNLLGEDSTFITGINFRLDLGKVYLAPEESDDILGSSLIDDLVNNLPMDDIIAYLEDVLEEVREKILNGSSIIIDGDLSMTGNNLEGTGVETGFAVLRPSSMTYNRAVNLKDNVVKESSRSFLLEAFDLNPDASSQDIIYSFLKSEKILSNISDEVLKNVSAFVGGMLDKLFNDLDDLNKGDVDAKYNWWGNNSMPPASKFKNDEGTVLYDPWLTLRVNADPDVLGLGEFSKITADTYIDSAGSDHIFDKFSFFDGQRITLSTDLGSFDGEKSVDLDWNCGQASSYLKGDEYGLANVSAYDYDTALTNVLIPGDNPVPTPTPTPTPTPVPENNTTDDSSSKVASAKTLPATANPIVLLFVVVMLFASVGRYRRK